MIAGKKVQQGLTLWKPLAMLALFGLGLMFAIYTRADRIPEMRLATLSGNKVEIPGKQLSWVNFWSINCPPCLKELPYLETIHKDYQGRMQVVAVSVPYDPPSAVLEYRDAEQFTLPMALDIQGKALSEFTDNLVVPSHYLLDEKGNILLTHLGELDEQSIRNAIEQHL